MSNADTTARASSAIHWVALGLLFLMIVQPTVDNTRALLTGVMAVGDVTIDVTIGKMALHIVAMIVGWAGLVLFFRRRKMGARGGACAQPCGDSRLAGCRVHRVSPGWRRLGREVEREPCRSPC